MKNIEMNNKTASRLDRIILMLAEFSRGNFRVREEVTEEEDPLNTVVAGLNMLGEELDNYKSEITNQRTFLHNILSSIDEVIYVRSINPDNPAASPYTFISGRSIEIIGIGSEELEQTPDKWSKAVHPDDKAKSVKMLKKVLKGQEIVVTYRTYHRTKQQYRWIEDRISPKLSAEGKVTHIYGSARDVTEQQEMTLELDKTSQLVTRLITSSDQVFYIVALDRLDPLKNTFTYLSAHVEGIIGYSVEDIRKDSHVWIKAIHPEDVEKVKATTKEMFKSKNPGTRVYRMKHKRTGEYVWLEDYVVPIVDEHDWVREFYASARDITARRKAEIERERLIIELSRRHDELMQFNHIVSHNLRSPVASILGLAQFLHRDMPPAELPETTGYILQAAHAMDDLLRDLNTVLSVRSTLNEKMETFSLSATITAVCVNLQNEIEESSTRIDVQVDPQADKLTSIKSYIQSALFNLVSNSIKYRSTERSPIIVIKVFRKNESTVISIEDNGLGIDLRAHKDRLFLLYSRLHYDREGKGLGLYMTKTQVESLNGSIEVKSEEGTGTTFTITI
jgi:PAS domain S-box-containing protein